MTKQSGGKRGGTRAPEVSYEPRRPRRYNPPIGLIGCGGITEAHLKAYRGAGFHVAAFADIDIERARRRRDQFYPRAEAYADYRELLRRDDIEVVDVATHPQDRARIIPDVLRAKKHVLSQKPFALDLGTGERLADLADSSGVLLAVNQNGRWAPYFSYMREAVAQGLIGEVYAIHIECHWDHETPVAGTPFERLYHVILYDFAIHWFDAVHCLMGERHPTIASATLAPAPHQRVNPPLLAQVLIGFDHGQASLVFDASAKGHNIETVVVLGTKGLLRSEGGVTMANAVEIVTPTGSARARLRGRWFPNGFAGTMGELLCAIEEKRQPSNNARDNLESLALCYAAVVSADTGKPQKVGAVRKLPRERCTIA